MNHQIEVVKGEVHGRSLFMDPVTYIDNWPLNYENRKIAQPHNLTDQGLVAEYNSCTLSLLLQSQLNV